MELLPTARIVFENPWEEGILSQVIKTPTAVFVDSQQELHVSFQT